MFEYCDVLSTGLSTRFYTRICLSCDVISPLIGSHVFTYDFPMATRSVNTREPLRLGDAGHVVRRNNVTNDVGHVILMAS